MNFQDVIRDVHDASTHSLKTNGTAGVGNSIVTVANVVSTTFSGNVTLDGGSLTGIVGNVTLANANGFIGLVSVSGFANPLPVTSSGNVTLANANGFIGLVSVSGFANPLPVTSSGNVTLDGGSLTGILGNVTLSDSKTYIGLTTTTLGASPAFVGIVTIANTNVRSIAGNVTLDDGSLTGVVGNVTLSDSKTYVGLTTTTLGIGTQFVGLVTAWSRDAGSLKTFIHKNIELSTSSVATLYVATETFKITQVLLNSDATVRVSIKSGVTYLTGNASIGITLNPGGGWVENGSPRSPLYYGLAVDQGVVLEKFDMTGTSARIGGKVILIDE